LGGNINKSGVIEHFMPREGKARVLNELEFKRLLIVAKNGAMANRNVAMVYCSFGLGLRAKEIASLCIGDVTNHQYQLVDEICLTRAMTKGEKQRVAYLTHKKMGEALQAHLNVFLDFKKKEVYHVARFEKETRYYVLRLEKDLLDDWRERVRIPVNLTSLIFKRVL
jgi:integrase/recombinase XerD